MRILLFIIVKVIKKWWGGIVDYFKKNYVMGCLQWHKASFNPQKLRINGMPIINIGKNAKITIGDEVTIASGSNNGIDTSCGSKINVKDNGSHRNDQCCDTMP